MLARCDDLREIVKRLAKVLPGPSDDDHEQSKARLEDAQGWSWRRTVIEAKPIALETLSEDGLAACRWRFEGVLPTLYQDMHSRRTFIRENTCVSTDSGMALVERKDGIAHSLPLGMTIWHAPDDARRLLLLAKHDARMLFTAHYDTLRNHFPHDLNCKGSNGVFTLFSGMHESPELCYRDTAMLLRELAPYVARLAEEYAKCLSWIYRVGAREFEESCRLRVQWIHGGKGTPVELLPASTCKYENGPVAQIAVGRAVVCHDILPVLHDPAGTDESPKRLSVPEGVMMIMDGPSRMMCAQGYTAMLDDKEPFFTLTFFLDCTAKSFPIAYERETRAVIMQTPVVSDRVVSTQIAPFGTFSSANQLLTRDPMGMTLGVLRRMLRASESHLLAERCIQALLVRTAG